MLKDLFCLFLGLHFAVLGSPCFLFLFLLSVNLLLIFGFLKHKLKGRNIHAYLRSEPLPKHILDAHGWSQQPCSDSGTRYQNALIFNPQCTISEIETAFQDYLKQELSSKTV